MSKYAAPQRIVAFLAAETPDRWLDRVASELETLLLDHANCELKAASTALSMIYRYPDNDRLVYRMSRLAREELRHFEQVKQQIGKLGIIARRVSPSRYAGALLAATSDVEPNRLRQRLIVGALIEARSCERFAVVAPLLPAGIAEFYRGLLSSESRHFEHYLSLAEAVPGDGMTYAADVERLRATEAELILSPDPEFRFHSGVPP